MVLNLKKLVPLSVAISLLLVGCEMKTKLGDIDATKGVSDCVRFKNKIELPIITKEKYTVYVQEGKLVQKESIQSGQAYCAVTVLKTEFNKEKLVTEYLNMKTITLPVTYPWYSMVAQDETATLTAHQGSTDYDVGLEYGIWLPKNMGWAIATVSTNVICTLGTEAPSNDETLKMTLDDLKKVFAAKSFMCRGTGF